MTDEKYNIGAVDQNGNVLTEYKDPLVTSEQPAQEEKPPERLFQIFKKPSLLPRQNSGINAILDTLTEDDDDKNNKGEYRANELLLPSSQVRTSYEAPKPIPLRLSNIFYDRERERPQRLSYLNVNSQSSPRCLSKQPSASACLAAMSNQIQTLQKESNQLMNQLQKSHSELFTSVPNMAVFEKNACVGTDEFQISTSTSANKKGKHGNNDFDSIATTNLSTATMKSKSSKSKTTTSTSRRPTTSARRPRSIQEKEKEKATNKNRKKISSFAQTDTETELWLRDQERGMISSDNPLLLEDSIVSSLNTFCDESTIATNDVHSMSSLLTVPTVNTRRSHLSFRTDPTIASVVFKDNDTTSFLTFENSKEGNDTVSQVSFQDSVKKESNKKINSNQNHSIEKDNSNNTKIDSRENSILKDDSVMSSHHSFRDALAGNEAKISSCMQTDTETELWLATEEKMLLQAEEPQEDEKRKTGLESKPIIQPYQEPLYKISEEFEINSMMSSIAGGTIVTGHSLSLTSLREAVATMVEKTKEDNKDMELQLDINNNATIKAEPELPGKKNPYIDYDGSIASVTSPVSFTSIITQESHVATWKTENPRSEERDINGNIILPFGKKTANFEKALEFTTETLKAGLSLISSIIPGEDQCISAEELKESEDDIPVKIMAALGVPEQLRHKIYQEACSEVEVLQDMSAGTFNALSTMCKWIIGGELGRADFAEKTRAFVAIHSEVDADSEIWKSWQKNVEDMSEAVETAVMDTAASTTQMLSEKFVDLVKSAGSEISSEHDWSSRGSSDHEDDDNDLYDIKEDEDGEIAESQ